MTGGYRTPRAGRTFSNAQVFYPTLVFVVAADVVTKLVAVLRLVPRQVPHRVLGDAVRLTLLYNPGAAFGFHFGPYSRWIFMGLAVVALVVLSRLWRDTHQGDRLRALALGLICGGAMANVINRLWSARGVVDWIDVGIGDARWPTFNVADAGITVGAVVLAWLLWREGSASPGDGRGAGETGR